MADRFSSTSQYDSNAMAKETDSLVQMQARQRKLFERRWYDNNFFDDGYHYRFVSRTTGRIVDLSEQGATHVPQRAIPKASKQIRGLANLIWANEYLPVVYPRKITRVNYPNPNDYQNQMTSSKDEAKRVGYWLQNEWEELDLKQKMTLMILLTAKHGVSYLEIYPDPIKERIKADVFDAFDIYLEAGLRSIYDSPYLIKGLRTPITEIKANEDFDPEQIDKLNPDNRYASSEIKQAYMQTRFGYTLPTETLGTLILKEGFFKEYLNDDNWDNVVKMAGETGTMEGKSKGDLIIRQTFSAGGVWLKDGYVNLKEYPFVDYRMEPGTIYQVPLIERMIPANKSLDAVTSRVERLIGTMTVGVWLKRRGENVKVSNLAGGQILEYDGQPPVQGQMAQIPPHVFNFMNFLTGLIDEQGAAVAANNQLPTGVNGWQAIESLKASDYANLKIAVDQLKDTIKRTSEKIMDYAANYFIKPQDVMRLEKGEPNYFDIIGEKGMQQRKEMGLNTDATVIKGDYKIKIEVESGLGFTEEGKRNTMVQVTQFMDMLAQKGYLTMDSVKVVIQQFFETFNFGATQEFMEALETGTNATPITEEQLSQMKIAVLQALKDAGEIGEPASQKRVQESSLGALQAIKDSGLVNQPEAVQPAKEPSQSISFKDLPASGKAQMAAKAGIQLNPVEILMNDQMNKPVINKPIQANNKGTA